MSSQKPLPLTLTSDEQKYLQHYEPNEDYTNKFRYNIFYQPDGIALKISEQVLWVRNNKTFTRWANHKSVHSKIRTLKDGSPSVNIFVRTKAKKQTAIFNVSHNFAEHTLSLIPTMFFVKHLIIATQNVNQHYTQCVEAFETVEQRFKEIAAGLENNTGFNGKTHLDNIHVLKKYLNIIVLAITYPMLFNIANQSNIISGSFNGSKMMLPILRSHNMEQFLSRIPIPTRFNKTRSVVETNVDKITDATVLTIKLVLNTVKDDEHAANILEVFFKNYQQKKIEVNNNYGFLYVQGRQITKSQTEYKTEFMGRLFNKTTPEQLNSLINNPAYVDYVFNNNFNFTKNYAPKPSNINSDEKIELGLLINYSLHNTEHSLIPEHNTVVPKQFIKSIIADKQNRVNRLEYLHLDLIDNKHLRKTSGQEQTGGDINRGVFPETGHPTIYREITDGETHAVLKTYHSMVRKSDIKNNPLFMFIPKEQTHILRSNQTSLPACALLFNDDTYQTMMQNMLEYANNTCDDNSMPQTVTNRACIIKGALLTGGLKIKNFDHFIRNMKSGVSFTANIHAMRKNLTFRDTKKLADIPEEWLNRIYPQMDGYKIMFDRTDEVNTSLYF